MAQLKKEKRQEEYMLKGLIGGIARGLGKMGGETMEIAAKAPESAAHLAKPVIESPMVSQNAINFATHLESVGKANPRKGLQALADGEGKLNYGESIQNAMSAASKSLAEGGKKAPDIENPMDILSEESIPEFTEIINREANLPRNGAPSPAMEKIPTQSAENITPKQEDTGKITSGEVTQEEDEELPPKREFADPFENQPEPPQPSYPGEGFNVVSKTLEEIPEAIGGSPKDVVAQAPQGR